MEYQRVRVLFADQLNLARGKYIPINSVNENGGTAIGICRSLYGVSYDLELLPVAGAAVLEGISDMEMHFESGSLRPGWERNTQVVIADLLDREGQSLPLDGRGALKRAIERWRALGYEPNLGIELEANIFERDEDNKWDLLASPSSFAYSTGPIADPARVADTVWDAASAMGLPLDSINGEYDRGCFELTLKYAPALQAIDDIFLFRTMAREVMHNRGYWLSFMPKVSAKAGGCGLHINFSLFDQHQRNALNDEKQPGQISTLAQQCIAGWMKYHRPSTALLAPIYNSYKRLQPASMSGYWTNWAVDHRGVSVRVSHEAGQRRRLEHRTADCACNPYVASALLLDTARLGVEEALQLQAAETGDCLENQQTADHVPDNLKGAVTELSDSAAIRAQLGDMLVDNFVEMKQDEITKVERLSERKKIDFYFPFI
ncbi:MAG: glutamine synthetase family protein [Gammaproteobacteria bacterium]|nr:glutamine synthetase family protein [Gammaproteobacteria bacterium]